jgi:hypothetical protein
MSISEGYLVVLKVPEDIDRLSNKRCLGVCRMPCYRLAGQDPIKEEMAAMDRYVFGGICDEESGLIPSYDIASDLLAQFGKSPREFEIIWCRTAEPESNQYRQGALISGPGERLGFDVATLGGEFWSIVADFPATDTRFQIFLDRLNESGLFASAGDAWEYLRQYQRLQLFDYDFPFEVLEVRSLESKTPGDMNQTKS